MAGDTYNINIGGGLQPSPPSEQPVYWDGETVKAVVIKSEAERRYTLSVAYPADSPDVGIARDGFRDFASPAAVEDAAWGYISKARAVGAYHENGTEGAGQTVESYIYRGPDWRQESGQVVKAGDWLIGIVWDEPTWNAIKSQDITGTSVQGTATRRVPSPADIARVVGAKNARS
jgi:Putative phage serine protease XkdF